MASHPYTEVYRDTHQPTKKRTKETREEKEIRPIVTTGPVLITK
jgi:hypothetical protein